ncbi:MAG TPA: hypothetical protein H9909_15930 [Candidatus Mediterraneibacter norfolkensis]|nr:hypothetical protein [Candidatus Mediterraneibacter norfolkensis]
MSTIAVSQKGYAGREEKTSLMERIRKYFTENAEMINAGLLMMNGNVSPYLLYRAMR